MSKNIVLNLKTTSSLSTHPLKVISPPYILKKLTLNNGNVAGNHSELIHVFQLLLAMLVWSSRLLKLVTESINKILLITINVCAIFYGYMSVFWSLPVFRFLVFVVVVAIVSQFASKFKWFVGHLRIRLICVPNFTGFPLVCLVFIIGGWCNPER